MRRRSIVTAALLLGFTVVAPSVLASPSEGLNFGTELNAAACDPSGGSLVVNVVQRVSGDIDSRVGGGYWAYDEYNRHIQVWQTGPTTFCAVVKYTGSFTTVAGISPAGANSVAAGVTGTMEGGYRASIIGTLQTTPTWKVKGSVGSFDYSCNAATGTCTGRVDWASMLFESGVSVNLVWWGWVYDAGSNGSWVNAAGGNSGDITGNP